MEKAVMSVRMKSWIKLLEEAAASGLPKGIWCDQNGINRRRFFYWQQKIREFCQRKNTVYGFVGDSPCLGKQPESNA